LCIAVYAVQRSRMGSDARVAIVGSGPIGLTTLLGVMKMQPRAIWVSEPVADRRSASKALGATAVFDPGADGAHKAVYDASDGGVDVAFECVGTPEAISDAAQMIRPGGTLVIIGIPEGEGIVPFDQTLMRRNEITIVNIRRQNRAIDAALPLLERRRDAGKVLLTHSFAPEKANDAFNLVRDRKDGVIKALIEF